MTEVINARVDAVPDGFTYFDTGFYVISHTLATRIANGKLPEHGRERLVIWADRYWWLARTIHQSKSVWSMRDSGGWKFNEHGLACLRGELNYTRNAKGQLIRLPTWVD